MKKYVLDLKVVSVESLSDKHVLIKLTDEKPLPEMKPGQFVEVRVDHSATTMLRRPISINFVDREKNQLWLLVAMVGDGTKQLGKLQAGDTLNCMLPLGNGFTMPTRKEQKYLLVGGGVGVAPLLYFGKMIKDFGAEVTFLLGARKDTDLLELDEFAKIGKVCITTEDGSAGEVGFVTNHSVLENEQFDMISTCGGVRGIAGEQDGVWRGCLPLLRGEDHRGAQVRLHRWSCHQHQTAHLGYLIRAFML